MIVFFGTGKYKKILIVIMVLILLIGSLCFLKAFHRNSPGTPLAFYDKTEAGVIFLEQNIGGYPRQKVEEIVVAKLGEWQVNPIDALYDPTTNCIVPEIWGYRANAAETVEKIISAAAGEKVFPVLEPLFPEVNIADYPSALIERGNPVKKEISFMVNVAWGTEHVKPMLDVLEKEEVPANFFVVGRWAKENEDLLREMAEKGHLLGNHGHTDSVVYTQLSPQEIESGLKEVNGVVQTLTGKTPLFFTPHKGEYNKLVLEAVARENMRTVLWSLDTVDWDLPGVESMKSRVLDNLHNGAIILMHPTEDTVTFLKESIPVIKKQGFSIVTLTQLFNPDYPQVGFALDDLDE